MAKRASVKKANNKTKKAAGKSAVRKPNHQTGFGLEEVGMAHPKKSKYCEHCGKLINSIAEICPKCGVRIKAPPVVLPTNRKDEGVSALLSFIFVGLGQIYNGQIDKGILFIIVGFFLALSIFVLIGFFLYPIFWIYNIYDAYNSAKRINAGEIKV